MVIIITMAGLGSRFRNAGYNCPKYMIEAKGKTLFEWSLESLVGYNENVTKYIFVVRKDDNSEKFIREKCNNYNINNIDIISLKEKTDGQATTCKLAMADCDKNEAIMIYNIDTYVEANELKYEDISGDGYLPCFHAPGEHWSFVKLDDKNDVVCIKEKERISDNCTLGAYYFASAKLFDDIYDEYYKDDKNLKNGEKYVAPMYNYMIEKGLKVKISIVDANKVHVLGTPEEVNEFISL